MASDDADTRASRTTGLSGETQRFFSTGSRIMGVLGLVLAVAFVVLAFVDPDVNPAPWGIALVVFLGVLVWVAMFRQILVLAPDDLEVHGMFQTVVLPLERIESVTVSQVTAVRADGKKYVSGAVGRTTRQIRKETRGTDSSRIKRGLDSALNDVGGERLRAPGRSYESMVEEKIVAARNLARERAELHGPTSSGIEKRPHWPEIAALSVSALAAVVLFLLR